MPVSTAAGAADGGRVERLLQKFVNTASVNPALDEYSSEAEMVDVLAEEMRLAGFAVAREPVASVGRDNVVAVLDGRPQTPTLLLEAHLDTVAPSGEAKAHAVKRNGRVYGRGACDAKGAVVAMLEAMMLLRNGPGNHCRVVFVGAVDEEVAGTGIQAFIARHRDIGMAVVGEPTGLRPAIAHKGTLRFRIHTLGVAAHSSRPELGVNAIAGMARVIRTLDERLLPQLQTRTHPLVGQPTLNVSLIEGGTGMNVVPPRCAIAIDRRLIPGEDAAKALAEVDKIFEPLRDEGLKVVVDEPFLSTAPLDTPPELPLVTSLTKATSAVVGETYRPCGVPYGSDGSFTGSAGIPTVVFGPGDIAQAHADEEWVGIDETSRAAEILALTGTLLAE